MLPSMKWTPWIDQLTMEEQLVLKNWISVLVERKWPVEYDRIGLETVEERKKRAVKELLRLFSSAFYKLAMETGYPACTAKACYLLGSFYQKVSENMINDPTLQQNWVLTRKKSCEFLSHRNKAYWLSEEGSVRMMCLIIQRTSWTRAGHRFKVSTLIKGLMNIIDDFSKVYGEVMGNTFQPIAPESQPNTSSLSRVCIKQIMEIHISQSENEKTAGEIILKNMNAFMQQAVNRQLFGARNNETPLLSDPLSQSERENVAPGDPKTLSVSNGTTIDTALPVVTVPPTSYRTPSALPFSVSKLLETNTQAVVKPKVTPPPFPLTTSFSPVYPRFNVFPNVNLPFLLNTLPFQRPLVQYPNPALTQYPPK